MSFTPFARYRNFTLSNLKALLDVYPDMERNIPWDEERDYAEKRLKGYKRTAYQQACQFGLEDRSEKYFRTHNYLYTFDDENLEKYLVFWFKTYYAPNPYVHSSDQPFVLYTRLAGEILANPDHKIKYSDFMLRNIGGKSDDILLNAIKAYATPIICEKMDNDALLSISGNDVDQVQKEISFIEANFPLNDPMSEHEFFERYSYANFCLFYGLEVDQTVEDGRKERVVQRNWGEKFRHILPQSVRDCAKTIIDYYYDYDGLKRLSECLVSTNVKIKGSVDNNDLESIKGNYLPEIFVMKESRNYDDNRRVFTDSQYLINGNECRLSNEWENTPLINGPGSHNNINALIVLLNYYYKNDVTIKDINGNKFIQTSLHPFTLTNTPFENNAFARRYVTSLLAKPFVILTGNSGTGKTRISKQFAEYLEKRSSDGKKNWVLVPVGADWTDNTKILGFYNPLADGGKGKYEKTEILELIERANQEENRSTPFFVILDEMNLSHVERYFADFLSHMETPDIPFVLDGYDGEVRYPSNLFVVGTVNIDETTYMFSPKVLDRANVIEFQPEKEDVLALFKEASTSVSVNLANAGIAESFMQLSDEISEGKCDLNVDQLNRIQSIFSEIYNIVDRCGFEFAYRTVKEIRQYISAALALDPDNFDLKQVVDEELVQKILPKIHGNRKEIGQLLDELDKFCNDNDFSLSGTKIKRMKEKLAKVQYASFI